MSNIKNKTKTKKKETVTTIDHDYLKEILNGTKPIPESEVIILTNCSPYIYPGDTVFTSTRKLILYGSEKYFADKWVFKKNFPYVEEVWLDNTCGGFFDFQRDFPKFYTMEREFNRWYPQEKTTRITHDEFKKELEKYKFDFRKSRNFWF